MDKIYHKKGFLSCYNVFDRDDTCTGISNRTIAVLTVFYNTNAINFSLKTVSLLLEVGKEHMDFV
jgi:hypothetical protein